MADTPLKMPLKMPSMSAELTALQDDIAKKMKAIESATIMPDDCFKMPSMLAPMDTVQIARAMQELHKYKYVAGTTGQQPAPQAMLEVRDVERLAKAGVTMTFEQIKDRIKPDVDLTGSPFANGDMIRPLYERWRKATPEIDMASFFAPWVGAAFRAGDKVKVLICTKGARGVMLEDDHALYPSDALLASLIMMLKTETP